MNHAQTVELPGQNPAGGNEPQLQLLHRGERRTIKASDCPYALGRGRDNQLCFAHQSASRHHGRIEWADQRFYYSDDSRNGTWVLDNHGEEIHVHHQRVPLPVKGLLSPACNVLAQMVEVVSFAPPRQELAALSQHTTRTYHPSAVSHV